jgi:hypothetical protein
MGVRARGAATGQRPDGESSVTLRTTADSWVLRRWSAEQMALLSAQLARPPPNAGIDRLVHH